MFVGIDYSNSYCGWQLIMVLYSLSFFVEIKMVVLLYNYCDLYSIIKNLLCMLYHSLIRSQLRHR